MANKFSSCIATTTGLVPEDIGGIIFDLNPNNDSTYTDSAKLVKAETGDTVYTFTEDVYGFNLIQATAGARPTLGETSEGIKYLYSSDGSRWMSTNDLTGADQAALIALDTFPLTVCVWCYFTATSLAATNYITGFMEENSTNGIHVSSYSVATPENWFFRRFDSATGRSVSVSSANYPYTQGMSFFTHKYPSDEYRLYSYVNGVYSGRSTTATAQGNPNSIRLWTSGSNSPTSFAASGTRFYRMCIFNKELTNDELIRLYVGTKAYYYDSAL